MSGQCKLLAMSGGSSNFIGASGSPRFVGAVVGGSILGSAVSTAGFRTTKALASAVRLLTDFAETSTIEARPARS